MAPPANRGGIADSATPSRNRGGAPRLLARMAALQQITPSPTAGNAQTRIDAVWVQSQASSPATVDVATPQTASPKIPAVRASNSANSRSLTSASASVMSSTIGVKTSADS